MRRAIREYINQHWVDTVKPACKTEDTLIGLPYPYTTPCISGMFQELYYWDTYFTNVGLLLSGMTEQAQHNIDNMIYLIGLYGKMPNGNRTYYLNRSQPPFLSQMVRELFDITNNRDWLAQKAYPALETEYRFWQAERMTACGLNRYGCDLTDPKDYEDIASYFSERIQQPLPPDHQSRVDWGKSMMALAESGWDCTSRFAFDAHECAPADLNSLLFLLETNMAYFAAALKKEEDAAAWTARARRRRETMNRCLWNDKRQLFCDRNVKTDTLKDIASAAAFYPLFAGLATEEQADAAVRALAVLEFDHGIACSETRADLLSLQWDHPHGWACLHYLVIKGLLRYGYTEDALRIAEKYTDTVAKEYASTHNLWEKYNVVTGNVSVTPEYDTPPMMGWSAGVYLYCDRLLTKHGR